MSSNEYSGWSLVLRLHWSGFGPCAWVVLLAVIGREHGALSRWDALLLLVTASMIAARYCEWRGGGATTMDGAPTTASVVHRYAIVTVVLTVAARLLLRVVW